MKKKLSILIALVMAISLCLVPAVVVVAGPGTEVAVPFGFSAEEKRPEFPDGSVSLVGEDLIIEFTATGQNAKPLETNKHTAIFFDANLANKDLTTASGWDMPWGENNYVLVYNWYNKGMEDPKSLSWRQSFTDTENPEYECPWGSPVPGPGTMYSDSVDWPSGLSFVYQIEGDDIKWTATVPTSLLGVGPGDTFGMFVAARDQNTDMDPKLSLNSWPTMVYGFSAGYDLRDYALVTIPDAAVTVETEVLADVIAISITPITLDFGKVYRGASSSPLDMTITNTGSVSVAVSASSESAFYHSCLTLDGAHLDVWEIQIPKDSGFSTSAMVTVPSDWPVGTESGTVIFWAEKAEEGPLQ